MRIGCAETDWWRTVNIDLKPPICYDMPGLQIAGMSACLSRCRKRSGLEAFTFTQCRVSCDELERRQKMNKTTTGRRGKYTLRWMTGTAIMIAIVLVLGHTPLGLIAMPFLRATTLHIPVIIATLYLGWEAGMICGLTFGIHSLISNLSGGSFFAAFFVNPLVSVLPRVLFPLAVYGLSRGSGKILSGFKQGRYVSCVIASALGTAIHTTMVMGMIFILYGGRIAAMMQNGLGVPDSIAEHGVGTGIAVLGFTNGLPELIVAAVIAPGIVIALDRSIGKMTK